MTVLRAELRELGDADRGAIRAMVDADPVGQCVFAARMARANTLTAFDLGGHLWGLDGPGGVEAACFAGGNLMPLGGGVEALRGIGGQLGRRARTWSSVVGHEADVSALWSGVGDGWGRPRSLRMDQPLLLATEPGPVRPDPKVVRVGPRDLTRYLPAALAMFSEELEIDPPPSGVNSPTGRGWPALSPVAWRWPASTTTDGCCSKPRSRRCRPSAARSRGCGSTRTIATRASARPGMAAVIAYGLALAPRVSLYVNDFNVAARRMYDRVGMAQVGTFATILF